MRLSVITFLISINICATANAETYIECTQTEADLYSWADGSYDKSGEWEAILLTMRVMPDGTIDLRELWCGYERELNDGWKIHVSNDFYRLMCWDKEDNVMQAIFNIDRYTGEFENVRRVKSVITNKWVITSERRGVCSVSNKKF